MLLPLRRKKQIINQRLIGDQQIYSSNSRTIQKKTLLSLDLQDTPALQEQQPHQWHGTGMCYTTDVWCVKCAAPSLEYVVPRKETVVPQTAKLLLRSSAVTASDDTSLIRQEGCREEKTTSEQLVTLSVIEPYLSTLVQLGHPSLLEV